MKRSSNLRGGHYDTSPGDGTRYDFVTVEDPYGGILVIWPGHSTWRYHPDDRLKFLHGQECEYARKAMYDHLQLLEKQNQTTDETDSEE